MVKQSLKQADLEHLVRERDRHGNERAYVRIKGARKQRVRGEPGSRDFMRSYSQCLAAAIAEANGTAPAPVEAKGSVGWILDQYLASPAWLMDLSELTRSRRLPILADFRRLHGTKLAGQLPRATMRRLMDSWKVKHGPHGANNRLKAVRGLYGWATERELVDRDATREVSPFSPASDGFHTWTVEEIRAYQRHWPLGTAPRVAMEVMLCTGMRIGDAYLVGPRNLIGGRIVFQPSKTGLKSGISVNLPVLPELRTALEAGPIGEATWIVGLRGRPFATAASLGTSFKEWCSAAGLPHCSAHGLRKAGATLLAQQGATSQQLLAIYGWSKLEQAERYTRRVDRSRLSDALAGGFGIGEATDD